MTPTKKDEYREAREWFEGWVYTVPNQNLARRARLILERADRAERSS